MPAIWFQRLERPDETLLGMDVAREGKKVAGPWFSHKS